jgi:hypothetical protein
MSSLTDALSEAGVEINLVQIPLGQERGFIRIWENGKVEFHLAHKNEEDVYPGEEDYVTFESSRCSSSAVSGAALSNGQIVRIELLRPGP